MFHSELFDVEAEERGSTLQHQTPMPPAGPCAGSEPPKVTQLDDLDELKARRQAKAEE